MRKPEGFKITCDNCGCDECYINDSSCPGYSELTPAYTCIDITCPKCGSDLDIVNDYYTKREKFPSLNN
jgi:hypothetical protein